MKTEAQSEPASTALQQTVSAAADAADAFFARVEQVRQQLLLPVEQLGLTLKGIDQPLCDVEDRRDPYDGSVTTFGFWRDPNGDLLGSIQVEHSGRVYAEYDVIANHPEKPGWFIESVCVWGTRDQLAAELQLLRLPS